MNCNLCNFPKTHKHGKTSKGSQRYRCPVCKRTFTENHNSLLYRRQVSPVQAHRVLLLYQDGQSFRGISRCTGLAYATVVSLVKAASKTKDQKLEWPTESGSLEQSAPEF